MMPGNTESGEDITNVHHRLPSPTIIRASVDTATTAKDNVNDNNMNNNNMSLTTTKLRRTLVGPLLTGTIYSFIFRTDEPANFF